MFHFVEMLKHKTSIETYEQNEDTTEVIDAIRRESQNRDSRGEDYNDLLLINATIKYTWKPYQISLYYWLRTGIIEPTAEKLLQILKLVTRTYKGYCNKIRYDTEIERCGKQTKIATK